MSFKLTERDLDLILLEELHSETGFATWLSTKLELSGATFVEAEHSVLAKANAKWGETDILAFFVQGNQRIAVLIEDKIAAGFTDRQGERYHERALAIVTNGDAENYATVLVAPEQYLSSVPAENPWDHRLAIEEIADWFGSQTGHHAAWREQAIRSSLHRVRSTISASKEEIRRYSAAFADYLAQNHSGFGHTITAQPWFIIRSEHAPANVSLDWKTSMGVLQLSFTAQYLGKAVHVGAPSGVLRFLASETGTKTDLYQVSVPMVDLGATFESQESIAAEVMEKAASLLLLIPKVLDSEAPLRSGNSD